MKFVFFIITALICIPGIPQEEVTKNHELNSSGQTALCETKVSKDAEVRNSPGILDDVIIVLPKGTKVGVYTRVKGYWLIKTSEIEGYTNEKYLKVTNKMERVKNDANAQDNAKAEANNQEKLIQEDDKLKSAKIKDIKIWRGMTKATVRVSLGEPSAVNRFYSTRSGQTVQWFYDNKSLYFENGTLVSWKDN